MRGTKMVGGAGAGAGIAAIVIWAWNSFVPDHQMPAEVGAAIGALPGYIIGLITDMRSP